VFGLVFIVAGLGFKLGAVPFHMWVPDVYQGAPTPVTLLIGSAPKLAAFAFVMRILVEALGAPALLAQWQNMVAILALLSMAVGNITTYMLMTLGSFGMILLLSREGFEAENLEDFKGLNQRDRWYAFLMLLIMFSLAGLPVMIGFWAKLAVLQAAFQAGYTGLVVAAVLFSLVGAYYYLRVVKLMYFDEPIDRSPIVTTADQRAVITVNGLAVLVLGIVPGWLLALCQQAIQASL
jgi:NADH-quinone oxidoreductase subunit N